MRTAGAPKKALERNSEIRIADEAPSILRSRPVAELMQSDARKGSGDLLPEITGGDGSGAKSGAAVRNLPRDTEALVGKLNAAARDLTEAIDGSLPRGLEKRYNAGESHVYTHHLYEARGRRLSKSVEERYKSERMVRGRVDSYVRLFERLLDTLSESPQSEQMVDASLASESGKLYLMLAQATGRISTQ